MRCFTSLFLIVAVVFVGCSEASVSPQTSAAEQKKHAAEAQVSGKNDGLDACDLFGWYDDGVCDSFCPNPDPDCSGSPSSDFCEEAGWYDDEVCDDFCPEPDPDCEDELPFCRRVLCAPGSYCDEVQDRCVHEEPVENECSSAEDCAPREACVGYNDGVQRCAIFCVDATDCRAGQMCDFSCRNPLGANCEVNGDCHGDLLCVDDDDDDTTSRVCSLFCLQDSDCWGDHLCNAGQCEAPVIPCETAFDCPVNAQDACVDHDQNPSTQRQCDYHCDTSNDCRHGRFCDFFESEGEFGLCYDN